MGLNEKMLKKATEMQAKMVAQFPLQVKQAMQKDVKAYKKMYGRSPTADELVQPFRDNKKFMDILGMATGFDIETMEKVAREVLENDQQPL